ncbi:MAG: diguanylate cyclase [Desulfovibrio sp.]
MKRVPVLIVDDRPENLLTLECLLESPELDIVRAESGQEALEKTLDYEFALVLLDVQMPGMDGYETAELLRGNKRTSNIPIIFVTAARKEREQIFKGYDSGAVDYLLKPLEPAVLNSKVGVFLELYRHKQELQNKTCELDAKIVELEELQQQLEESNEQLRLLSSLDGLTGLPNRRCFDEILDSEWQRSIRNGTSIGIILVDIDHFKKYNDTYGHIAGDHCLRQIGKALDRSLHRNVDIVARFGGEEFVAILPGTDMKGASLVAGRMQQTVEDLCIDHASSDTAKMVTVSIGVSAGFPASGDRASSLVDCADKALYEAKHCGRNCSRIFDDCLVTEIN